MNMNKYLAVSVIIPTMNRPESLKNTIESIMSKEYVPNQIIVVDQSPKKSIQDLNRNSLMKYSRNISCKYVYQVIPSLTKARNNGFKYCENEILVFSDDDIEVKNDTLINIYNIMQNDHIAMIAALDENMKFSRSILGYFFFRKSFLNRHIGHVTMSILGRYPKYVKGELETQWAMGYFFIIKKTLINLWGIKWDENLSSYAYAEDLDFSYTYYKQAKKNGKKCIISEKVKVKHLVSQDFRINSTESTFMFILHREYLSYKHFLNPFSRLATRWANLGELFYRIIYRNNPIDLIKAQIHCDKYRKDIKQGILDNSFLRGNDNFDAK